MQEGTSFTKERGVSYNKRTHAHPPFSNRLQQEEGKRKSKREREKVQGGTCEYFDEGMIKGIS